MFLKINPAKTTKYEKSFVYQSITLWNQLNDDLNAVRNFNLFKTITPTVSVEIRVGIHTCTELYMYSSEDLEEREKGLLEKMSAIMKSNLDETLSDFKKLIATELAGINKKVTKM